MPHLDTETLDMMLDTFKRYAARKLKPEYLLQLDKNDEFPKDVLRDLYDPEQLGLHLLFLPEAYGGFGGGAYEIYRVSETMAGVDLGISTGVLATFLGTDPLQVGGTEAQKKYWMTRIAEERLLVAYAATEPQAGSDLAALSTKAEPIATNGQVEAYKLNGQKQWISNGGVASLYTVLANAPGGPSWFVVEKGQQGLSAGNPEDKHGIRASNTASVFLEDVMVPADHLIGGKEGQGLAQAQAVFGYTRLMVAAFGLGAGWAALSRAIQYGQERIQAGQPLFEKQGYTHKLIVPHAARLEAARAYIEWTAERIDKGEPDLSTEGAIAKYLATEAGNKAAEDSIQALGGYGYTKEYCVEKIKRDIRITTIYEGTSEIMEWTIARDRWQQHLKTRGQHYHEWATKLEDFFQSCSDTGLGVASIALRTLGTLLERCRVDRLTRNQHLLFRLGELIAFAETAAIFSTRVSKQPSTAISIDNDTQKALARIHAREAAFKVASDGLRWAMAAGQTDLNFFESLDLRTMAQAQTGLLEDMTLAAKGLKRAFPAKA